MSEHINREPAHNRRNTVNNNPINEISVRLSSPY